MPANWSDNAKFAAVLLGAYLLVSSVLTIAGMAWKAVVKPSSIEAAAPIDIEVTSDPGTGCQYIVTARGGITPRLAPDGRPICIAPEPAPEPTAEG